MQEICQPDDDSANAMSTVARFIAYAEGIRLGNPSRRADDAKRAVADANRCDRKTSNVMKE
ncbi:hypothetical protein [Aureimonas leprariae]|uniref:Uncharacterized protein n=1 Tax=Plantimonas leprariae TaxID=2615207 RepID=A0A7V7TUU5_9HYPH|nr:hypothetical protein [Aureimonas leprariae]KAB0676687.1 hypothetical protein F6X38_20500 [Aureimonas leprariae]